MLKPQTRCPHKRGLVSRPCSKFIYLNCRLGIGAPRLTMRPSMSRYDPPCSGIEEYTFYCVISSLLYTHWILLFTTPPQRENSILPMLLLTSSPTAVQSSSFVFGDLRGSKSCIGITPALILVGRLATLDGSGTDERGQGTSFDV
jgi:hypothetical protein